MSHKKLSFRIDNLGCASCAAKIEREVGGLPQIDEAIVDFAASKIYLKLDSTNDSAGLISKVDQIVRSIEDDACLISEQNYSANQADWSNTGQGILAQAEDQNEVLDHSHIIADTARQGSWYSLLPKAKALRLIAGTILFVLAFLLRSSFEQISIVVFIASWLTLGLDVIYKAFKRLFSGRLFDENFLMTIATVGALAIREYPEAVAVMLFYQVGEMFQDIAVNRSRASIKALTSLRPDHANLLRLDSMSEYERIAPEKAAIGDRILIKPGERVPLDGYIISGDSDLDTSALTGESLPQAVGAGDQVLAGSINAGGLLIVEVVKPYAQSSIARIMELVEEASARKSKAELFISRFAAWYTPIMTISAALLAFIPPLILSQPFSEWIYRAMILLVISCPCALVLSVPMSYFAGLGTASASGVLIKGAQYLDRLSEVKQIVFDKTGTLTEGKFTVTEVKTADGTSVQDVLGIAALLEVHSDHPIAVSIQDAWEQEKQNRNDLGNKYAELDITNFQERSGFGVQAIIDNHMYRLGNDRMLKDINSGITNNFETSTAGQYVWLIRDDIVIAQICLADTARAEAKEAIASLRKLGITDISMLTGDRNEAAASIAVQLGLDSYHAELLPLQKVEKLESLMSSDGDDGPAITMFVGDGINDAPVLARADIGAAVGSATDAAVESSDMMIMGNDLGKLASVISLSRKTAAIVRQNVALTLGLKLVVMSLAVVGLGGIWQAVFADVGVSLLAVLNALRLLKHRAS